VAVHDSGKHAAEIVELDTKKFRIAKAASELEIESERLESELEMLKERLADLESQGLEGDETTRREREADDATMCVAVLWYCLRPIADMILVCDSKYFVLWASILNLMRRVISIERSFAIAARVMFMSLISTLSSPASSMQTTSGQRCRDDHHDGQLCESLLSGVSWRLLVLFLQLLVFLYPWIIYFMNHTPLPRTYHTCQPDDCLGIFWPPK
jgi:hypothetical protein